MRRDRIHRNLHFRGDWSRPKWSRTCARWKQNRFQSINRHYVSMRSMHRLQSNWISPVVALSKARSREMSNKREAAEWEERWGSRRIGIVRTRFGEMEGEGGRMEELNKCLPAEICVPIFETLEFPRTAKWHHTFTALSSLSPLVRLTCGSIFLSLWCIHTCAPKFI